MNRIQFLQKYVPYVGISFTIFVAGSLVYLHLFATVVTPHPRHETAISPNMMVCEEDPLDWITPSVFDKVDKYVTSLGYGLGDLQKVPCSSLRQCQYDAKRSVPCEKGQIVVSLRDKWFSEDHAGETLVHFDTETGEVNWAAILLPQKIFAPEGAYSI